MSLLLIQILDSDLRVNLVLVTITSLGVLSALKCVSQLLYENQQMIDQYMQNPYSLLAPLGIEEGSFKQILFEHRLHSRDVRSFFTTGNTAGSFGILSLSASAALFCNLLKDRVRSASSVIATIFCGIASLVIFAGVLLTHSKGAIISMAAGIVMLVIFVYFRKQICAHKKLILFSVVVVSIVLVAILTGYGMRHGTLPGGNSMFVRWQYFKAAVEMIADHPLAGVGGGNFGHYYTYYKAPDAIETVADPHNFILSIGSQYGIFGLIGFLAIILIPMLRCIFSQAGEIKVNKGEDSNEPAEQHSSGDISSDQAGTIRQSVSLRNCFSRKAIMLFVVFPIVCTFILPTVWLKVVFFGFFILAGFIGATKNNVSWDATRIILFIGITSCLIHNTIDYAIFEPVVLTTFFILMSCLVCTDFNCGRFSMRSVTNSSATKLSAAVVILSFVALNQFFVLRPISKAAELSESGFENIDQAHEFLNEAASADVLDAAAVGLNGDLYLQQYDRNYRKGPAPSLLEYAINCYQEAAKRDRVDYSHYKKLANAYNMLAEAKMDTSMYEKAFYSIERAVQLYPASAVLRIEYAQAAERVRNIELALENYNEAVRIEQAYREVFKKMYPDRELFSRLGEDKYQSALLRIEDLTKMVESNKEQTD
jgi:O-antigen ligase